MSDRVKKEMKLSEYREKVNPGHKTKYDRPLRPRSAVFKSKKDYSRKNMKKDTREACDDAGFFNCR